MKLRHSHAILFSGFLWMGVGVLLLTKGIQYLVIAGNEVLNGTHQGFSLIKFFGKMGSHPDTGAIILISLALLLGFFKGRVILKKSVKRVVGRIRSFPSPIPVKNMYTKGYLMLIGGMMLLGMVFKVLPIPLEIKGFIDFTIGTALINGAMLYYRAAYL